MGSLLGFEYGINGDQLLEVQRKNVDMPPRVSLIAFSHWLQIHTHLKNGIC